MATRKQSNPAPSLFGFAPNERQPAPLARVIIKPTGWTYADRIEYLKTNGSSMLDQVGPAVEYLAKVRLSEIDAAEAQRRQALENNPYKRF
jgi:hypothetical protein